MSTRSVRWAGVWLGSWLLLLAPASGESAGEIARAEELVRQVYFEGLPDSDARAIGDAGAARLAQMLADPAETRFHANIVTALGMSARTGAYDALTSYAACASVGELEPGTCGALLAMPYAMGHLARVDGRALGWLADTARSPATDPGWSCESLRGPRLAILRRRAALMGLAISGRPEVPAILREVGAGPGTGSDPGLAALAREARALHARVVREGPEAAHARSASGSQR